MARTRSRCWIALGSIAGCRLESAGPLTSVGLIRVCHRRHAGHADRAPSDPHAFACLHRASLPTHASILARCLGHAHVAWAWRDVRNVLSPLGVKLPATNRRSNLNHGNRPKKYDIGPAVLRV